MSSEQIDNVDLEFQAIKNIFDKYSFSENLDENKSNNGLYYDGSLLHEVLLIKENMIQTKKWDNEGNLVQIGYYTEKGKREGEILTKKKRVIVKENYKDDKKNGICKRWRDGKLIVECYIKDDELDGEYKVWYIGGNISTNCYYKDGKLDGLFKHWYDNGKLYKEFYYKDGKFDGECKEWWRNGNLKFQCYYKDGILQGLSKEWDYNGNLLSDLVV